MTQPKLFSRVRCKAYMKRIYDTVRIQFFYADGTFCYDKYITDYDGKAIAYKADPNSSGEIEIADLSEFDGSSVKKTYHERTEAEFDGVVVGYTHITATAYIGTDWFDSLHGEDYGFCFKKIDEYPKVGVVYFRNNCKRYVLPEDMEIVE